MSNRNEDSIRAIEERLRSWVPSAGGLDRDRMLFEAGRAEVQGPVRDNVGSWLWRFATAASLLLASSLGWAWQNERSQRRALELTVTRLASPSPASLGSTVELMTKRQERETSVDPMSYLALVRKVNRLEESPTFEQKRAEPGPVQKMNATSPPRPVPMRPHDFDRVIAL
jgi:hypothetical protein